MSASEKLKALGEHGTPAPWTTEALATQTQVRGPLDARVATRAYSADAALIASLRNALPQIVAVVEAAEQFGAEWWSSDYTDVAAALTALERVLDGE